MRFRWIVIAIAFLITSCSAVSDTTVKITNLQGNSGGSGTIIHSTSTASQVLTNAHVCKVAEKGGLVHGSIASGVVSSYQLSNIHDLCLITVPARIGYTASISSIPPRKLEESTVSGHPKLLPTIVTKGHFSDKMIVQVTTGFTECSAADWKDPNKAIICLFLGKLPVIRSYESIVTSATVQPGSSGSGVFGEHGQLSAVIFAGSGEIGYGVAVPQEYVKAFLDIELKSLPSQFPDTTFSLSLNSNGPSKQDLAKKFKEACDKYKKNPFCIRFKEASYYSDLIERR